MKLLNKQTGGTFSPHPETDGPVKAVIVDVTPPKPVETKFGLKDMFKIVYETEVMDDENDRRWCVWSRGYTCSINEKSNFRKDLRKILGRDLTKTELEEGFDTEALVGKGVKLIVQHEESQDGEKVYAVVSFLTADKDKPLVASGTYTRVKDRDESGDAPAAPTKSKSQAAPAKSEDDWADVVVHVGRYKGTKVGDLSPEALTTLVEKWVPKAGIGVDDRGLVTALTAAQALIAGGGDDY